MDQTKFNQMFREAMTAYRKELQDNDCGDYSEAARKWATETGSDRRERHDNQRAAQLHVAGPDHPGAADRRTVPVCTDTRTGLMGSGKRLAPQTGGLSALLGRLGFTNCLAVLLVLLLFVGLAGGFVLAVLSIKYQYTGALACWTVVFTPTARRSPSS